MFNDMVVDTNVFVHASNPDDINFQNATLMFKKLSKVSTMLCLDPGFSTDQSKNHSLIMGEYLENLGIGTVGYNIVQKLAASYRFKEVDRKVDSQVGNLIYRKIEEKKDRKFVKIAFNSNDHILISHDYEHFTVGVRHELNMKIGVNFYNCEEYCLEMEN
ncbi:MAG: hypothetical protein ACYC59_10740 [Anaerolineaceae bacterium]